MCGRGTGSVNIPHPSLLKMGRSQKLNKLTKMNKYKTQYNNESVRMRVQFWGSFIAIGRSTNPLWISRFSWLWLGRWGVLRSNFWLLNLRFSSLRLNTISRFSGRFLSYVFWIWQRQVQEYPLLSSAFPEVVAGTEGSQSWSACCFQRWPYSVSTTY